MAGMANETGEAVAAKSSMVPMLLCCVVTGVLAVGGAAGAMVMLAKKGMLAVAPAPAQVVVAEAAGKAGAETTHPKAIEPVLINLADEGGHAYLRLGLVLEEEDEPAVKGKEAKDAKPEKPVPGADASVRDTIFDVMGRKTAAELLQPDGKEQVKTELKAALDVRNPELKVKAIYITDFLVQR